MDPQRQIWWIERIRYFVMWGSAILAVIIFIQTSLTVQLPSERWLDLSEYYGLFAIYLLYLALLATPLTQAVPGLPLRGLYIKARRAIGVSAFMFGLLHGVVSFWGLLDGFSGLAYLDSKYLIAITFSFTSLLILAVLASTSFDAMVRKLGARWKVIHRFVYLAAFLLLLHSIILGSQTGDLSGFAGQFYFVAVIFLVSLESLRIYKWFLRKYEGLSPRLVAAVLIILNIAFAYGLYRLMRLFHVH